MGGSRGAALVDLLFTCGVAAVIAAIAVPAVHATRDRDAARMAARYLANRLQVVRLEALRRNVTVAMRFDPVAIGRFGPYLDGDADGVRQVDVDDGVDQALSAEGLLTDVFDSVTFRIPRDVPDPDGDGTLTSGSDPLRIGSSNFLSFSPIGSATSGTIYLAATNGPQMAVRVMGATGRMRVLWFELASQQWREE
jgi:Tfp pilus assembly protein FimT